MFVLSASMLRRWHVVCAALLLCIAGAAQAQSNGDAGGAVGGDTSGDPPDRVARLSYLDGDIGLLPAGAQDWGAAEINRPLTRGDKLSSGPDARAELELDGGTLRIDRQTRFGFLELSNQLAQVELTQGSLNLAVRQLGQGQSYEIDTPTVALVVDHPGTFRVDVGGDGQSTTVTAFDGDASVYGENNAQRDVHAGRSYQFRDPALQDVALNDIQGDAFDDWSSERDRRYAQPTSRHYVSEDVVGYQDLDRYGDWQNNSDYGQVWYPSNVASDWAPYRDGHWSYVAPWGWSWVDDSPWGFAPYHYGRWAYVGNAWGWVPGPVQIRPIYAPALVAFVGGNHWGVSIGGGGEPVGWFPLGPGEVYNPWYRSSRNYYTQVNVTNINVHNNRTVIINNINHQYNDYRRGLPVRGEHYANRDAPRGLTAVPARSFAGGQRVQRDLLHVNPRQVANAAVLGRAAMPRATPRSLEPPGPIQARPRVRAGFDREVVARHAPPAAFADRRVATHAANATQAGAPARPLHVRLLADHGATLPAVHRIEPASRPATEPAMRAAAYRAASRPAVARDAAPGVDPVQAFGRGNDTRGNDTRAGELPSARFAHARREASYPRAVAQSTASAEPGERPSPRPGVSYISSNPRDHQAGAEPKATNAPNSLPSPPHFQRVTATRAPGEERVQRFTDTRQPPEPRMRDEATSPPRFGRSNSMGNSMRAPDFNAPPRGGESPQRFDRPPPGYQPPHGDGPPRPMPQGFSSRPVERAAPATQPARRAPAATAQGRPASNKQDPEH